jgi:hypothetical protein
VEGTRSEMMIKTDRHEGYVGRNNGYVKEVLRGKTTGKKEAKRDEGK